MTEKLLQFAWQFKLLANQKFVNQHQQAVEIIDVGCLNTDAGPDFFNAKIKIGNTLWAGNVEMHLKSSYWKQHRHHTDKAYNNVVLHVVLEHDQNVYNQRGDEVCTIQVEVPQYVVKNDFQLREEKHWLKCSKTVRFVDPFYILSIKEQLVVERLEYKTKIVENVLNDNACDWEQTAYVLLARSFGFNVNTEPFVRLAQKVPYKILMHHGNDLALMEALLYGSAGFLDEMLNEDDYYQRLAVSYRHLQHKYGIQALQKHIWKFAKTRPGNFPTIRIAQFAQLYFKHPLLFSILLETQSLDELLKVLIVSTSAYWEKHYRFNAVSGKRIKQLGKVAAYGIVINTIVPLLFSYGKQHGINSFCDRALLFLEQIPSEKNSKVKDWERNGMVCETAKESQAMLHLRTQYCDKKKCMQCKIGHKALTMGQTNI